MVQTSPVRTNTTEPPPALPFRVGHGFDLHRLEEGYPLIIGGIPVKVTAHATATPHTTAQGITLACKSDRDHCSHAVAVVHSLAAKAVLHDTWRMPTPMQHVHVLPISGRLSALFDSGSA